MGKKDILLLSKYFPDQYLIITSSVTDTKTSNIIRLKSIIREYACPGCGKPSESLSSSTDLTRWTL